jgi:hypothetical protein
MDDYLNPWLAAPSEPPYWLPCDSEKVCEYNATHPNEEFKVQEKVLPEPFIGNTKAPVVLLNLNPGYGGRDPEDHARPEFQSLLRNNYSQGWLAFPFYSLDPTFENGGRRWWEKNLRYLLDIVERNQLARSILCIEYFPYHSRRFDHGSLELPSQKFGFGLARSAIARGAVIVIMRARKRWLSRVPELEEYSQAFALNSPQNVVVSPRNCPRGGFDRIVSAIRDGGGQT